ncbi:MAG: Lrp/AsnC family transcriptional regulator [archaeon]|nr:Lrp/AsnC family transcriptional regulator [archaeon]
MDKIDEKIVEMLKANARVPFTDIGKKTGLSEGAVRYRIKSLVDSRIIKKFTIELGEAEIKALICVKSVYKTDMKKLASEILNIHGVERISETSGEFDMIISVFADSTQKLNKAIDSIRTVNGVISTNSYLILQEHEK